jgi:4'-phosphopantetheinyl transferase
MIHFQPPFPNGTAFFAGGAVAVVLARLDVGPEAVRESSTLLSEAERHKVCRFSFARDRRRFIIARARLRQLLGERLGVRPESVELVYGERGKPALSRRFAASDLHFNVSHSDDIAVYAFSSGREIGIDVEAVRTIPDADEIAKRFFSRRENEAYLALDSLEKPLGFFNCWTRKEAFIKALGDGLCYPLDRIQVSLVPGEPARILRVGSTAGNKCGWTLHSFLAGPGLVGAIVVREFAHEFAPKAGSSRNVARPLLN